MILRRFRRLLARALRALAKRIEPPSYRDVLLSMHPVAYWSKGGTSGTLADGSYAAWHRALSPSEIARLRAAREDVDA